MTEEQIKNRAKKEFERLGWLYWFPPRIKFKREKDIFGVFDVVALSLSTGSVWFIQLTDKAHIRDREKKVRNWLNNLKIVSEIRCQVWGYDAKKNSFQKIIL